RFLPCCAVCDNAIRLTVKVCGSGCSGVLLPPRRQCVLLESNQRDGQADRSEKLGIRDDFCLCLLHTRTVRGLVAMAVGLFCACLRLQTSSTTPSLRLSA